MFYHINMKKVRKALLYICIFIFLFSSYKVITYFAGTYENKKMTSELIGMIKDDKGREMSFSQKYDELINKNSDFVGWISIEGTKLNYPVMQTVNDEEYYLRRNFNKEYEFRGTLFVNANANLKYRDDNIIIYGHNMDDGTMFGALKKYVNQSYYDDHKYIKFETMYENSTYEIAYVFKSVDELNHDSYINYYQFYNAASVEEFDNQMRIYQDAALYNTGVIPNYGDKLITLSTCEYSHANGRLVIVARKIED